MDYSGGESKSMEQIRSEILQEIKTEEASESSEKIQHPLPYQQQQTSYTGMNYYQGPRASQPYPHVPNYNPLPLHTAQVPSKNAVQSPQIKDSPYQSRFPQPV